MVMGNVILKVSHVGTVQRQAVKYNVAPSEEDLAIAKCAADRTRKTWAEREKREIAKKLVKLSKRKKAQEKRKAAKAKRDAVRVAKLAASKAEKHSEKIGRKSKRTSKSLVSETPTPAAKMGISEVEFDRRLKALRRYHLGYED